MPPLTDEQKAAIESISDHVLVSAGAGSGKTFVLVERYIQILQADVEAGINDIIAVTYTRKAAEEMRSRLKSRLKGLAEETQDTEQERWLLCLSEVENARIGTIHSLCESILKNYPSEAGIDPGFEILDDLERAELLKESIDEALHFIIEQPLDDFVDLLDYPIESLRLWLGGFLRSPLKYKESKKRLAHADIHLLRKFAEEFINADIERTLQELMSNKEFRSEIAYLQDTPWSDPESKLGLLQDEMLAHLKIISDIGGKSVRERWQAVHLLAKMESARNAGGPSAKELRLCIRLIKNAIKNIDLKHKADLNQSDELAFRLLRALIILTNDALLRYERLKQQKQKLDFDDLIEGCQRLLCTDSDQAIETSLTDTRQITDNYALKQLSKNLRALLVDEFQDTNWTQAKLLTALAGTQARLFLIGDDKQSIYKFQGADVGTFNVCKSYISSRQEQLSSQHRNTAEQFGLPLLTGMGRQMTLSQSFRSHPEIVNFVNHLFGRLFDSQGEAKDDFKSRFQALRPAREKSEEENTRVEIIYTPFVDSETPDLRTEVDRSEAELTAAWIKEKIASGKEVFDKEAKLNRAINYSDFAILLQANSDFREMERALSQASIPYVSIAGSGFLDRQEVFDLENFLKWLVCPQDSHALFAILRSPIFAYSDDILHELKAGKPGSLWQCLMQKANEDGQDALRETKRLLQELQYAAGNSGLCEILRRVVLLTGYDMVLLSTAGGRQKSRNVWKFLSLASQHKHMGIAEFLRCLKSMRELNVKNLTDAPLSADNAVKIMTIHKSKGLEFTAVALPKLSRGVHQKAEKLLFGKDLSIAFDCTRDSEEEKPAFFMAANNLSRRMDEEEKKRLLYVALTRARDYLALFITQRCKRGTSFGRWLIEGLELPEPEGAINDETIVAGAGDELCSFTLKRALAETADRSKTTETLTRADAPEAPAPISCDYSLLSAIDSSRGQKFSPVAWQQLLRVCPTEETPSVHATIQGNYFHLLMGSLGPNLELPSETERRALLMHHEVAIHNIAQKEFMLKESERQLIAFKNSPLHSMMKSARRLVQERAYLVLQDSNVAEFRPDLIIEDASGNWQIVDYKTDQFELKQLSKQIASHQPQLTKYVEDLEALLGIRAKAWIYFAHFGKLEAVNLSAPVQLSLF